MGDVQTDGVQAEAWVHLLREGLKTAKLYMTDEEAREKVEALIRATQAYSQGPPSVQEGDCLQVGDELWPIERGGDGSTISFHTPRCLGFVFRVEAAELIAAGVPVVPAPSDER